MIEFWQTFAIAVIPSIVTAFLSYLAASKNSKTQIEAIKLQNKADIEKLVEQNKIDIEALKEKHRLDMEIKEKDYQHQIELINLQHQNELKKDEENVKNQLTANALGGFVGALFSPDSPISGKMNEAIAKGFEDAMKKSQQ